MRLISPRATRTIPLLAIGVGAVIFLYISYQSSLYTSQSLTNDAVQNVQTAAQIQAHDTGGVLGNELQAIASSLNIIAASYPVETNNVTAAAGLFNAGEKSNDGLTANYFWVAANGTLILNSNGTSLSVATNNGGNLTQRPYFADAEKLGSVYYSSVTPSLINGSLSHVFVSLPLYTSRSVGSQIIRTFDGVVGASIDVSTLGKFLKGQISPAVSSSVGLLDPTGVILYSGNLSSIGQNFFGPGVQSELPPTLKTDLDNILNQSLRGNAGVAQISYLGSTSTIAYQPVFVGGTNQTASQQFGVVYIVTPDILAGSDVAFISQERVLSLFLILGIAGLSAVAAVIVVGWNKRLDDTVRARTADLESANERISAYARAQTDFVNMAAHELRTPTQAIVGYAEFLEEVTPALATAASSESQSSAPARKLEEGDLAMAVDSILRNAKRLKKLTDDILSASRIETNTLALSKETLDLNALAEKAISEAQQPGPPKAASEQNKIRIDFNPESPELLVDADAVKISEVISNLLSNALKFSGPGGSIVVSTGRRDGEAYVSVRDNGTGISSEMMPILFNRFATNSSSGTGLGLFISKKVIEAHGGRMSAQNNEQARGSTFTFTLPLHGDGKGTTAAGT